MSGKYLSRQVRTLCGALVLLCGSGAALADGSGKWVDGKEVYDKTCAFCHEKGIGPQIKGLGLKPADIINTVRHGARAMPAFRETEIDRASLAKLADYIK